MNRNNVYRILDANINRVAEGVRVIEEVARFVFQDQRITEILRVVRHQLRESFREMNNRLLVFRDAENDIGEEISQNTQLDRRNDLYGMVMSNFKRVQEGLRTIEENLKVIERYDTSKQIEALRFQLYTVEKETGRWWRQKLPEGIYGITAEKFSNGRSNIDVVKQMIAGGVRVVQYREKRPYKSFQAMLAECETIRQMTAETGVLFIVNDYVDLALMTDADGVHIGQDDYPVDRVRQLIGDKLIGVSTHSPEQAQKAIADGADYIGVGPLFATNTKEDVCAPVGLDYLRYAVQNVTIPFVAIGGIKEHNLAEVARQGARTVALVTEIVGADDIVTKVARLRRILRDNGTDKL